MNCPNCNTSNVPEARFCKSCGTSLITPEVQSKSDEQAIKALIIIIGIDYLLSLIMFIIQKLVIPYTTGNDGFNSINMIYKVYGWTTDIVSLAAMFFFLINLKNKTVKTALVVFIIIRLIFMIGYRLMPLSMTF